MPKLLTHTNKNLRLFCAGALACATRLVACDAPTSSGEFSDAASPAVETMSAPAPALESPVIIVEESAPGFNLRLPRAGVVTAGDIDDTLNLAQFIRYQRDAHGDLGLPMFNLRHPVLARLTGPDGRPAPGVTFTLRRPGADDPFYTGISEVNGNITVFPAVLDAGVMNTVELRAFPDANGPAQTTRLTTDGARAVISLPSAPGWAPDFLDLAFVVDTTGSMGDELAWLTRELRSIVRTAQRSAPDVDIRYSLIVYRDRGDEYTVRNYGFTSNQAQMARWLRAQSADGGGDYPEAAADALEAAVALDWRRGRGERLLFHIADAPPHSTDARAYLDAARDAAAKNIQIFGLGASGVAAESEFLMRQAALHTPGRYLFLTNDSGVGNSHAEPTLACYRVTELKSLMTRVLQSELTGQRIESPENAVLREVGSYRAGVCRT
jgi:hypothetical protein